MTARDWFRENGYGDVADLIDGVMSELKAHGSKERRNWWDVLAGGKDGKPIIVNGHEFPVLRVAQIRQGRIVTKNAISRNEAEVPPDVVVTDRWKSKHLPSKARKPLRHSKRNHAKAG